MRQADIFLNGEGDAWFERNRENLGQHDPVSEMVERLGLKPKTILEVGCANGWRLAKLRDKYSAEVIGVDPSRSAGWEAARLKVPVHQMTASTLPVVDGGFDLIIYGFCLYLTDPKDWFHIVANGDGALAPGGSIIIHDFAASRFAYAKKYKHRDGLLAYHFDFAELWMAHPQYCLITRVVHNDDMVTVLRKSGKIEVLP